MLPEDEITDLDQLPQSLPGHSISLTPEIKLDDEIILTAPATVDAFTMETTLAFEVQQLVGETKWVDGPLTRAVREGGICYLDEVVEARKDVTVVLHPLTDDRRILPLERTGEELHAPPEFMLVASYNPGYQHLLKSLKPSTRQRFAALNFDFPPPEVEIEIVANESGLSKNLCAGLINLARQIRELKGQDLEEGVSTRLLVYCASLIAGGMALETAARATLIQPLSDDEDVIAALEELLAHSF